MRLRISLVIQGTGHLLVMRLVTIGACWLYRFDTKVLNISTISSTEVKSKMACQGTLLMSVKKAIISRLLKSPVINAFNLRFRQLNGNYTVKNIML